MILRPYQESALAAVWNAYRSGLRRVLVSLPTGTGKTIIFASIPKRFRMRHKMLVLAHREELLDQAAEKFAALAPDLRIEIEQAGRRASPNAQVIVASVQTLVAAGARRLEALDPAGISIVVIDEAHHAAAPSYQRVVEHLGLFEPATRKLLLGVTATPKRGDGVGLSRTFEQLVYQAELADMIETGYLARIRALRVRTNVDLDAVKEMHGELSEPDLARAVDLEIRNRLAVAAYREHAVGRPALAFCVGVAHAQHMAERFHAAGVPAAAVWGAMPRGDRARVLADLRAGRVQVVCNMGVLTEGFDEPRISCIVLARPTLSVSLLAQMVGRGTRLCEGKQDLLVLDLVDQSMRHTLRSTNDLFDLPGALNVNGVARLEATRRFQQVAEEHPWADLSGISELEDLRCVAQTATLFRFAPPRAIADDARLAWVAGPGGAETDFVLRLPEKRRVRIQRTMLDEWEVEIQAQELGPAPVIVGRERDRRRAVQVAEQEVMTRWADVVALVDTRARWRTKPASEKQRALLERRKIPTMPNLTAGQASWMIAQMGHGSSGVDRKANVKLLVGQEPNADQGLSLIGSV